MTYSLWSNEWVSSLCFGSALVQIQLFTSMRIRIQGANQCGDTWIRILVKLCSHKKLDFDMKNILYVGNMSENIPKYGYKYHFER
jgi:hypothetical protein